MLCLAHTKNLYNKEATIQYDSPVYAEVPEFMSSINTFNMNTLCGTELRTSSPRIWNYADSVGETGTGGNFLLSHATPRHTHMVLVRTQPQKLHS